MSSRRHLKYPPPPPDTYVSLVKKERERLFDILKGLLPWSSIDDEHALIRARKEIERSWRRACRDNAGHPQQQALFDQRKMPGFHDPFAGGGAIPLEAQRLGLDSLATDLNPVAVLLNKALVEMPAKFANLAPINAEAQQNELFFGQLYHHAAGLAADVQFYGSWLEQEGERRTAHLFPKVEITEQMTLEKPRLKEDVGGQLTVIAWIWARTVRSPNPAFQHIEVPLATTFVLSRVKNQEAYVEPVVGQNHIDFVVRSGKPPAGSSAATGTKVGRGGRFRCLKSGVIISRDYIIAEAKAGRMGTCLLAIVVQSSNGKVYVDPTPFHEAVAKEVSPKWRPAVAFVPDKYDPFHVGMTRFDQLFSSRQIIALDTLAGLLEDLRAIVRQDAVSAGLSSDEGESGAEAYARAIVLYLGLAISKAAGYWSSACVWDKSRQKIAGVFGIQAVKFTYDFAEANGFSGSTGSFRSAVKSIQKVLDRLVCDAPGRAEAADAQTQHLSAGRIVSTDPPYYDNIAYAELADFYYVWLRRSLRSVFPALFTTVTTPKTDELVAFARRHANNKDAAKKFFERGMTEAMRRLAEHAHPAFPVTVYYAFKQSETRSKEGQVSTGWETFLEGILAAGFRITHTWPIRTEMSTRMVAQKTNALASSIVLVLRQRSEYAKTVTRQEFVRELNEVLPAAIRDLQHGGLVPVDMAQAAIGPGMSVFSKYARVLHVDGNRVTVGEALGMINKVLDSTLTDQGGDLDADTLWAAQWFEVYGFDAGPYDSAEILAKAKGISVRGIVAAGILDCREGTARLLSVNELSDKWDPFADSRLTAWEALHHLIRALENTGEYGAAKLTYKLGPLAATARELSYRLYRVCEQKKWQQQAVRYNALVQSWASIRAQEGKAKFHLPEMTDEEV